MKRFLSLLLAAGLLLCLCACGSGSGGTITRVEETPAPVEDTPAPVEEAPAPEASAEPTPGPIIEQPDLSDAPDTIGEAQQAILEQFILIDELVAPGTAGSSLRSAAAAASLLDWAENAELTDEVIGVIIDYMAAKSTEGQAEFGEKLDALDSAVQLLTGADSAAAEGLLGDAGMLDSCGYPWSERAVRTVEGLMQALGRRAG